MNIQKSSPQKGIPRKRKCKASREHLRRKCPVTGCPSTVINLYKNHYISCHKTGPMSVSMEEWDRLYAAHNFKRKEELCQRRMTQQNSSNPPGIDSPEDALDVNTCLLKFKAWMTKPSGGCLAEATASNYVWLVTALLEKVSNKYGPKTDLSQQLSHLKACTETFFEEAEYSAKYLHNYVFALKKFCIFCENYTLINTDMATLQAFLDSIGKYFSKRIETEHFNSENVSRRIKMSFDIETVSSSLRFLERIGFIEPNIDKFKSGSYATQKELNSMYCLLRNTLIFRLICTNGKRGIEVTHMKLNEFKRRIAVGDMEVCHVSEM